MSQNDYTKGICPVYSVDVRKNGMAYFILKKNGFMKCVDIDLKKEGVWEGKNAYSAPHPERHFICHENGELVITSYNFKRLMLFEYHDNGTKTFFRARQWELDWWFSKEFPDSGNAKIYNILKSQ